MLTLAQLPSDNCISVNTDGGCHLVVDPLGRFKSRLEAGVIEAPTAPIVVARIYIDDDADVARQ